MNILPHKSWHVRTKKNIARVRKDEAKAAAEEKEIQRRIALAAQEDRTRFLRDRASKRLQDETVVADAEPDAIVTDADGSITQSDGHINFFQSIEDGTKLDGAVNKEHEEEKKKEQEEYEKKIGYLVYLGQDSLEHNKDKPWYEKIERTSKQPSSSSFSAPKPHTSSDISSSTVLELKREKLKEFQDPLKDIRKYLSAPGVKKAGAAHQHIQKLPSRKACNTTDSSKPKKRKLKKEEKKHRKHKSKSNHHHKKSKHAKVSSEESAESSISDEEDSAQAKKQLKLEQLRAERLERERQERKKAEKLLERANNPMGEKRDESNELENPRHRPLFPIAKQKYNSQFNPHLARQNFDTR